GPELQHAAELANRSGVGLLEQQAVRRQDVRGVVLWIGGDNLAERRLRAAAITGTKRLLRVAHLLLDFRRLRECAGSKEKQKQSAHGENSRLAVAGARCYVL